MEIFIQTEHRGSQLIGELSSGETRRCAHNAYIYRLMLTMGVDVLRRAFQHWLTAKRAAEHRRINHERKEAHLRQVAITSAWERWRERFKEEKLRPLVCLDQFSSMPLLISA